MSHSRPVYVFIPGAWHTPDTYDGIRALLKKHAYESHAVATPSLGAKPPNKGLYDDAEYTRDILEKLADEGKQIVLVTHSYSGMVDSIAVEGLGYPQRRHSGKKGGVIMLVYMSAFAVPKGKSLFDALGGQWIPWMKDPASPPPSSNCCPVNADDQKGDGYIYPTEGERVFYYDLTPEEQQKRIALLMPQPTKSFLEPITYEPWHDLPCMYIFCQNNKGLPMASQEAFSKTLGDPTTFRCDGAHSPFLSVPEQLLKGLEVAAKAGAEKSGISAAY